MQRRSEAVSGWVNFPVKDPAWRNTLEGGTVVKLVVCDNRDFEDQFGMCAGADVFDVLTEALVGDDRRPTPSHATSYDTIEAVQAEQRAFREWEGYHYPHLANERSTGVERELSRPYVAAVVLGTTGWSGWHAEEQRSWVCRFEDLNEQGQALYRQFELLYPGCDVHLLTFLDT